MAEALAIEGIDTRLGQAAEWLGCDCAAPHLRFHGVCTAPRTAMPGALFVALKGPNHDAHEHLGEAANQGAVAALVEREVDEELPQLVVKDSRIALGDLARAWREELGLPLVAITGSNGKTTTKEMTASVLRQAMTTHATAGNFNNHVGVPLTLLSMHGNEEALVTELGANHRGEIRKLARLVAPETSVITNVAPAHLQGFGSLDGVLRAKIELFEETDAEGICIWCADNKALASAVPDNFANTVSFFLRTIVSTLLPP